MMRSVMALCTVCVALLPTGVAAQQTTGAVRGRLVAPGGEGVGGITVTAQGAQLLGTRAIRTASDGGFLLLALPPGEYTVTVRGIGYVPVAVQGVPVEIGRTSNLGDIAFAPAAVAIDEVRIVAARVTLDPMHTELGARMDATELAALPTDRDFTSVLAVLPQANVSFRGDPVNVGGATGLENAYFVDGVNVTAPLRLDGGTRLPFNFVRAVEVKTGGYEAQYGRALGALVNAVTYSGSNEFEGSVFGFFTTDGMSARARQEPTIATKRVLNYDVGVRVGGPVVRDRLWFSAAYNPRLAVADRDVIGIGLETDRQVTQIMAGKLTWQPTPSANLELTVVGDPGVHDGVELSWATADNPFFASASSTPYQVRRRNGGVATSLHATVVRNQALYEATLARSSGRDFLGGRGAGTGKPSYVDTVTNLVDGGWPEFTDYDIGRTAAAVRATYALARHQVVIGTEYEAASVEGSGGQANTNRITPTLWTTFFAATFGEVANRTAAAFMQDAWRVTPSFTLNAGLRWSKQTLVGAGGTEAHRLRNEWQPRVGFVWMPGGSPRHRVLGSAARFYQTAGLYLSTGFFTVYADTTFSYDTDPRLPGAVPFDTVANDFADWKSVLNQVNDARAEHTDEFSLGYERLLSASTRASARVVHRRLQSALVWAYDYTLSGYQWLVGVPGEGNLDFLPSPSRRYTGLELALDGLHDGTTWRASYVLSRNHGNYSGVYDADLGVATPGGNRSMMTPASAANSTGLLPNDRTHAVKVSGARALGRGVRLGAIASWMSGTPTNRLAPCPCDIGVFRVFAEPRGSAGRTPSLWSLDLRATYRLPTRGRFESDLYLDVFNLGNPQQTAWTAELAYLQNTGGVPSDPNPNYGTPIAYQRPMMARVGMEVRF